MEPARATRSCAVISQIEQRPQRGALCASALAFMAQAGSSTLRRLAPFVLFVPLALAPACATGSKGPLDEEGAIAGGAPASADASVCILHNCNADAECGGC